MTPRSSKNPPRSRQYTPLESVAQIALQQCGIFDPRLTFISDTDNIVYRGDTASGSFCIRIYADPPLPIPEVLGELTWLLDLRKKTDLLIPIPVSTTSGQYVQDIPSPGGNGVSRVVIFRWMDGNILDMSIDPESARQLGGIMANLHSHAEQFTLPEGTSREASDWHGMGHFRAGLTPQDVSRLETLLDEDQLALCEEAARRAAMIINTIDTSRNHGLIHADLHPNNCLIHQGRVGILDFDDCQFAPFPLDIAITASSFLDFPRPETLETAFYQGYTEKRSLPGDSARSIAAFSVERRLRLIRWVATWSDVDHHPFGRSLIRYSLPLVRKFVAA